MRADAEKKQLRAGAEKKPRAGAEKKQPSADSGKKQPRANSAKKQLRTTTEKKPRTHAKKKQPRAGTEKKPLSADDEKKRLLAKAEKKRLRADAEKKRLQAEAERRRLHVDSEKRRLRPRLLEKRDGTSEDLLDIASKKIQEQLRRIKPYKKAETVGAYYSIGSEIRTGDIIQELLSAGKRVCLPKTVGDTLEFREIKGPKSLEYGRFDIKEPKDSCPVVEALDVVLVPTVGVSHDGTRIGYGHGYYDRFLAGSAARRIALTLETQLLKYLPATPNDQAMSWIVTEDRTIRARAK